VHGATAGAQYAYNQTHPGEVNISAPAGETVGRVVNVGGSVSIPNTTAEELWVVVRVDVRGIDKYFPQGRGEIKDGKWTCAVTLGGNTSSAKQNGNYVILAVLAEPGASQQFSRYVREKLSKD
jgi:hypothetical protein